MHPLPQEMSMSWPELWFTSETKSCIKNNFDFIIETNGIT